MRGDYGLLIFTRDLKDIRRRLFRRVREVGGDAHVKAVANHALAKIGQPHTCVVRATDTALAAPNGGQEANATGIKYAQTLGNARKNARILHGKKSSILLCGG